MFIETTTKTFTEVTIDPREKGLERVANIVASHCQRPDTILASVNEWDHGARVTLVFETRDHWAAATPSGGVTVKEALSRLS